MSLDIDITQRERVEYFLRDVSIHSCHRRVISPKIFPKFYGKAQKLADFVQSAAGT